MTTTSISELGKKAIAGALPAGIEVREEAAFEQLEAEVAKLSSVTNSGVVNWPVVTQLSTGLLTSTGKDLLVACYLASGLLETRSIAGLADGMKVIADLLEDYWDTLYPSLKRLRGRRNALQWLVDRVQQRATDAAWMALPPQDAAVVAQLQAALQTIDAVLMEQDADAPSVRALINIAKALPVVEPEPEPARKTATAATEKATTAAKVTAEAPAAVVLDSGEQADAALGEVCARLEPIAEWLLNADLANPLPYRLDRLAAWTSINALPFETAGKTPLPGPISQVVDALLKLKSSQADEDMVHFAEAQLATFPFWLDLNCMCAAALARLGSSFDAARLEVGGETARFVARLPGLEKLSFASGMPFADGDTLAWLASLASAPGDQTGGKTPGADAIALAVGKAKALAANEDLTGAVDCLQQQIGMPHSASELLFLRIRLCELLFSQRPGAALDAFALEVVESIDRHHLAAWDPVLALDGLQVAYRVMTRNEEAKEAADGLLKRIVSLDAGAAVKLVT